MKRIKHFSAVLFAIALMAAPLAQGRESTGINLVPYPQKVTPGSGVFKAAGKSFNCDGAIDPDSRRAISLLANRLGLVTGKTSSVATPSRLAEAAENGSVKGFIFLLDKSVPEEGYTLTVDKKSLTVRASSYNGFLYSIQTIKQLLPPEIYGKTPSPGLKWVIPCLSIEDSPRFGYRGLHLDCARHFFSVDEVKKVLDLMAIYKMNRLHWHLTDDQGWRVEIEKYPRLTSVSAYRNGTMVGKDFSSNDNIRYGGYYTKEQLRDVVKYASSLGITIIPEIDLPGHMVAALTAYPELGCTGGPYEVWPIWGISDDVLCPGKDATFEFLENVFLELIDIFPSEYIHIGGDECPKKHWKECPDCQARIKELGLTAEGDVTAEDKLQNYVTARMQNFLNEHGRKIIGWDEILLGDLAEGATVMSWRGVKGGIEAAGKGFDVIMTPNTYLYFDYYQSGDRENEPLAIGGNLPISKTYGFEPLEGIPEEAHKHILGVQANLWTEYIATPEHLEYMIVPRIAALSELQWCSPEVKDWERFRESAKHLTRSYEILGYNYRPIDF